MTPVSGSFVYLHFTDVINLVSVIISWGYLCGAGCPVGSNHFVGEPLCVEVPVRVLRVFLGNVTSFFWGGGGNVTFRGIQVSAGTLYTLIFPLCLSKM